MKAAILTCLTAAALVLGAACEKEQAPVQAEQVDSGEVLTEDEEQALQEVYENEAAKSITPDNAEQVAEELESEIEEDLAELK